MKKRPSGTGSGRRRPDDLLRSVAPREVPVDFETEAGRIRDVHFAVAHDRTARVNTFPDDVAPVVADGPAAYFATLPVRAIHDALIAARIPAVLSNSAGTFVCNHVFYTLMHHAVQTHATWRGGFVHVPAWRDNDAAPVMTLDDIVQGLLIALQASAIKR